MQTNTKHTVEGLTAQEWLEGSNQYISGNLTYNQQGGGFIDKSALLSLATASGRLVGIELEAYSSVYYMLRCARAQNLVSGTDYVPLNSPSIGGALAPYFVGSLIDFRCLLVLQSPNGSTLNVLHPDGGTILSNITVLSFQCGWYNGSGNGCNVLNMHWFD
jgi:hypothetical protein